MQGHGHSNVLPIAITKTVIAVAHRLSTIQHADCIYVIDGGRVVESGTHSDLIERRGTYSTMCKAQAGVMDG
jgi:ABC-type multidrug transport system fused ATPase/permease subunit